MKWFLLALYLLLGLLSLGATVLSIYFPPPTQNGLFMLNQFAGITAFMWGAATVVGIPIYMLATSEE